MKNILLILVIITGYTLSAQDIVPIEQQIGYSVSNVKKGKYFKDVNGIFNKFLGDWHYQSDQDNVEARIFKRTKQTGGEYATDEIYILIKYTKNGNVVYNTLYTLQGGRVHIFGSIVQDTNNLQLYYSEPGVPAREQTADLYLEYFTENEEQKLKWHIEYVSTTPDPLPFKMPYAMVLTKVN